MTRDQVAPEDGLHVYNGVKAGSAEWRELWNKADLFVFPSQMETFGIVLVEAMAFGVPIISTNTGAAEELLGDGLAGEVLPSTDASELERAIRCLIGEPELRARMSANGRSRFLRDFDLTKNAKRLVHLIRGTNPTE